MQSKRTSGWVPRSAMLLLAVLGGYVTMFLLILAAQEGLFGGVSYRTTPLPQLLVAGALTNAAAVVGGAVAARIYGKPWFLPALCICGLVVSETTYMILANRLDGPVWFDGLAAGSLLVGLLIGGYGLHRLRGSGTATPVSMS